jgi:hypothetical protein
MDAATLAYLSAYTPPLSVLALVALTATIVLVKLDADRILSLLDSRAALLLLAALLFCLVLVTHLFQKADWTADLLKVLAGVLVGAASSMGKKETTAIPSATHAQSITGDGNVQAGRDVIGEMRGDIKTLRDSIVNQSQTINQIAQAATASPRLARTFHERFETSDARFVASLQQRQREPDYDFWTDWVEPSLRHPEIGSAFRGAIDRIHLIGWRVEKLGFDSVANGIHVNIEATKALGDA